MRLRQISTIAAALALSGAVAFASEPAETIEMDNGSVYMGHTSRRDMSDNTFRFLYSSATIVRPADEVKACVRKDVNFDDLSDAWKEWFDVHPQYIHIGNSGKRYVIMHQLEFTDGRTDLVVLLSRTPKEVKYHAISGSGNVTLADSDVTSYNYGRRDDLDLTGIVTEIVTVDGDTIRGQLVLENAVGKGILTDDDVVEIVPSSKLAALYRKPLDPMLGILNQVQLLDEIEVEGGSDYQPKYSGVISRINYRTNGRVDLYLVMTTAEHGDVKLNMSQIKSKGKVRNSAYEPKKALYIPDENSMLVNGEPVLAVSFTYNDKNKAYSASSSDVESVVVDPVNGKIVLAIPDSQTVELKPVKVKNNKGKKDYTFKTQDSSVQESSRQALERGVALVTYTNLAPGTYVIYIPDTPLFILITIPTPEEDPEAVG